MSYILTVISIWCAVLGIYSMLKFPKGYKLKWYDKVILAPVIFLDWVIWKMWTQKKGK